MQHHSPGQLVSHNSSEDSTGTLNFHLRLPATSDDLAQPTRRSTFGDATFSGIPTENDSLEPPRRSFGTTFSSEWPPHNTFVPPMHGPGHSRHPSVDPELASILSPTVSLAGPLSRQMSMASYRSSMALTAIESTIDASRGGSRMSLVSNERHPVPDDGFDDVAQEAADIRASLTAVNQSLQAGAFVPTSAESPRIAAGKGRRLGPAEPGLADMADALASATGAPPWFSPELARKPRAPIGTEAYTALLRAVLTAWQQEPDAAEGLLQRLHFTEYLRDILQVPEETHSAVLTAALGANASMHNELQQRLQALEITERLLPAVDPSMSGQPTPPSPTAASGSHIDTHILDKSHFLTDEAFRDYVTLQLSNVRAAKALVEKMPLFSGVLRVESFCLQGLGGRGKKKGKGGGLFSCCINPKFDVVDDEFGDSLFFKLWLSVSGEKTDKEKVTYTTAADAKTSEGPKSHTRWPDGPLEFTAGAPAAMLCMELRNMTDLSVAARSALGKPGSGYSFERLGSVSVRVSDLRPAGTGKHRCTVSLFALPSVTVATGASDPLASVGNPTITQTLEERDVAAHEPSADSTQGKIIATLTFVYELILDVRKLPEGHNIPSRGTFSPPEAPVYTPAAPASAVDTAFTTPPAPARNMWQTGPQATSTDDITLAVDDVKYQPEDDASAEASTADSDDSGLGGEDGHSDVIGVGMATGGVTTGGGGDGEEGAGGSPILSRRLYKQGSLLDNGSRWATPKANTPRITRAKTSNRRSAAHPFATSGPSRSSQGSSQTRERESFGHRSQKSFRKLLANSSKREGITSIANMHGGNVGFDGKQMNPGDGKWLEGYHGSSAAFVEAFMCLWGLWREKVEAGTAAEMARVILPQACIPEWLEHYLSIMVPTKLKARQSLRRKQRQSLNSTVFRMSQRQHHDNLSQNTSLPPSSPPPPETSVYPYADTPPASVVTPSTCDPLEAPSGHVTIPSLHEFPSVLSDEAARVHLPPQWMLSLLATVADNMHIRAEEALLLALTALSSTPPLSSTAPTFPSRLHALRTALTPLAAAARTSQLTHGEAGSFARGVSPLLAESAWALDRMHVVLLSLHGPDTLVEVVRMTAEAIRFTPEPSGISPLILPHFREAVARRMIAHHALTEVTSKYEAVPVLVEAMRTCISDLRLEAEMIPDSLGKYLAILPVSASYRYGMIVSAVQRLWKIECSGLTPRTPKTPVKEHSLLYDGLLQQLEDTFQELHLLMIELGVTELVEDGESIKVTTGLGGVTAKRGSDGPTAEPGSVTFLPCTGVKFLDITVLLSPVISSWLSAVGIKLESYAASAIAADSQGGNRSWAPVARLSGVMCSSSVLDLFYVIINGVDKVAARTIVKRPPVAAVAAAEALAAAAGGAIRWYAGAVEASALADLQQVALAAHAAHTLPPAGRALLTAHLEEESGFGTGADEASTPSPQTRHKPSPSWSVGSPWPPLIKREFSVKLNNLQEASLRTEAVAYKLAQYLSLSDDPLRAACALQAERAKHDRASTSTSPERPTTNGGALNEPIKSMSPEVGAAGKRSRVMRAGSRKGTEIEGVAMRGSMEQLAVAAEMKASASLNSELSFMSDGFARTPGESGAASEAGLPEVGDAMLPSDVHHVFFEVLQYVARCKLAILAAIKHAFCGVLTLEIAKVLAPAASTKQSRLSGFSLVRTLSDTLGISSEPAGRATNDSLPAVLEDSNFPEASKEAFRMTFNMGRNPIMHGANNGSSKSAGTASSQQIQKASSEGLLDSAALGGLLEIIDREFQVMKECLVPQLFDEVHVALWRATCEVLEGFLLSSLPSQNPLAPPQVKVLESLLTFLKDYFHADGAGIPMARLDNTATRAERLFQLFASPTEALGAHWEVLLEDNAAGNVRGQNVPAQNVLDHIPTARPSANGGGGVGASTRRAADVTQVDLLRLLRQRKDDARAKQLLQSMLVYTEKYAMQILFDLPDSDRIVARSDCTLMGHEVAGTIFLSSSHLCFSSMAPSATHPSATQSSLQRLGSASAAASALFGSAAPPTAAVTMMIPLEKVTTMSDAFIRRHRALVFTLLDKTQVEFAKFRDPEAHPEFQQAVRLHVAGTGSTLDRTLRGVEMAAAPAWLKLPPGEHVERSYACALYSLVGKYRGALHVCREILLFAGYENKYRTIVRFEHVLSVELSKGHWLRGVYVVVTCSKHPHKLEFCELAEPHAEEMVAEILDCIARHN